MSVLEPIKWTNDLKQHFVSMWVDGAPPEKIGEEFNIGPSRVKGLRRELGCPSRAHTRWTPAMVDELRALWKTHTAEQIGDKLGVSRSAVCAKIMRLGLVGSKPRPARIAPVRKAKPIKQIDFHDLPMSTPVELHLVVKRITLVDLERNHCRWPCDEENGVTTNFCGCDVIEGMSYCAPHARMAYQEPKKRV